MKGICNDDMGSSKSLRNRDRSGNNQGEEEPEGNGRVSPNRAATTTEMGQLCPYDVVFGRGGLHNVKRKGSVYHDLIERHWQEYSSLSGANSHRRFVQSKLVKHILENNGRFLTWKNEQWEEVHDMETILKVIMQALRDRKRNSRSKQERSRRIGPDNESSSPRKRDLMVERVESSPVKRQKVKFEDDCLSLRAVKSNPNQRGPSLLDSLSSRGTSQRKVLDYKSSGYLRETEQCSDDDIGPRLKRLENMALELEQENQDIKRRLNDMDSDSSSDDE